MLWVVPRLRPMKTYCFPIVVAAAILAGCASNAADSAASKPKTGQIGHVDSEGFTLISDGSWTGWKVNENPASWSLAEGGFKAQGERSHNFYTGPLAPFKDFELKVDVKTAPNSNGGIYIHTKYQDSGWPWGGYETQVNQTQGDWRKSGSIYSVQDVKADKLEGVVRDNEWYTHHVIVKGNRVQIFLNGKLVNDFTEEAGRKAGKDFERKLSEGTIAFQAHDPKSVVMYLSLIHI